MSTGMVKGLIVATLLCLTASVVQAQAPAGIDAAHIADAARELAGRPGARGRPRAEVGSGRRE